jgi:hypothetical protein
MRGAGGCGDSSSSARARGARTTIALRKRLLLAFALAAAPWPTVAAQRVDAAGAARDAQMTSAARADSSRGAGPRPDDRALLAAPPRVGRIPLTGPWNEARRDRHAPWWAPVASALAPGSGQAALGHDRWLAYAALEGVAWLRFGADHEEARREARGYRRIADRVARALYAPGTPRAGDFEYYETMEKWIASGVYDALPDGDLQPETDESTFNGAMWLLARQTYWARVDEPPLPESEAFRNAMAFYERRAIRPEFRWSWRDAQLEQDLYRRTILRSNAASRRATQDLAAVLANHVLSTVDAYITVRLRRRAGPLGGETRIEATLPWP